MGVPSDGAYGVPEGLVFGFPVTVGDGRYRIVHDLPLDDVSRRMIDANVRELTAELDAARGSLAGHSG
jgi:malate dehydrogenase